MSISRNKTKVEEIEEGKEARKLELVEELKERLGDNGGLKIEVLLFDPKDNKFKNVYTRQVKEEEIDTIVETLRLDFIDGGRLQIKIKDEFSKYLGVNYIDFAPMLESEKRRLGLDKPAAKEQSQKSDYDNMAEIMKKLRAEDKEARADSLKNVAMVVSAAAPLLAPLIKGFADSLSQKAQPQDPLALFNSMLTMAEKMQPKQQHSIENFVNEIKGLKAISSLLSGGEESGGKWDFLIDAVAKAAPAIAEKFTAQPQPQPPQPIAPAYVLPNPTLTNDDPMLQFLKLKPVFDDLIKSVIHLDLTEKQICAYIVARIEEGKISEETAQALVNVLDQCDDTKQLLAAIGTPPDIIERVDGGVALYLASLEFDTSEPEIREGLHEGDPKDNVDHSTAGKSDPNSQA